MPGEDFLYDKFGEPMLDDDGTHITWNDLMAAVGRMAIEDGKALRISDDPVTGEERYRITDPEVTE